MTSINPGYVGLATFPNDNRVRCTGFGINVSQTFEPYNHVLGINDFIARDTRTKVERPGRVQVQKTIIRPSPITISGPISFPITDGMDFPTIFNYAKTGAYIDEITYQYFCDEANDSAKTFSDCRIGSMELSVTAGEIVNSNVNIFAKEISNVGPASEHYETPEKIFTWDKFGLTVNDVNIDASLVQGFSLSINNNIKPIFTASPNNQSDLGPHDLRLGAQDVTGEISVYGLTGVDYIDGCPASPSDPSTITIVIGGLTITINCVFFPRTTSGNVSTIVSTIQFMGVDYALGQ